MPLYFAYGANLDEAAFVARCPRSKLLGAARLMRHRLVAMREGWLTVVRDPRALWDLALADAPALDRFEEVASGLYAKIYQPVVAANGPKRALVYVGANAGPGRANGEYISSVLASARRLNMPEAGIAALERLAREAGVRIEGEAKPAGVVPKVRPLFATPFDR